MADTRHYIIGTAGHIDHGKSSLVKVLTGTNPDRLPEEKARGMTIDLGFAHLSFPDPANPGIQLDLGIIDVPGHADFVKNMVAGVGAIDLALFVVAADDSWMPQSEEHLHILSYLAVRDAVIALTKSDLAEDIEFVTEDVRASLAGSCFENAPIVPVSSIRGDGLDALKAAIADRLKTIEPPSDKGKPRLLVDRVFSPTGIGTVVTGTLTGGTLSRGESVIVQPSEIRTHIRAVQNHNQSVESSPPGTRTALNIPDVPIATREKKRGIQRGDTITLEALGSSALAVDVLISKLDREIPGQPASQQPIRHGQKVRCHHGSADHPARIFLLDQRVVKPGEETVAEIRFESPVYMFAGDRIVLRDWAKKGTIGGGVVIDPDARPRRFRKDAQRRFLDARATAPDDLPTLIASLLGRDLAVPRATFLAKSRFSKAEIADAIAAAESGAAALARGGNIVHAPWWIGIESTATGLIRSHHLEHPDEPGLPLSQLRRAVEPALPDKRLFEVLLDGLYGLGFVRIPGGIRASSHVPELPPDLRPIRDRILAALAENPIEPPNPKEILGSDKDRQVFRFLCQTGEVVDLDEKCALLSGTYRELCGAITDRLAAGRATASEIRELLGTTRRVLIPLLERLDREGVTLRDGDYRTLKKP